MPSESELSRRAFAEYVAGQLGGAARAIVGFQELAIEQARDLGLDALTDDLERVLDAAIALNVMLDNLMIPAGGTTGAEAASIEATLRHDLRTPLNAIIGYSEMVAEELEQTPHEDIRRDVARVLAEASNLLERIDDIVDFSKADVGESAAAADQALRIATGVVATIGRNRRRSTAAPGRILVIDDVESNRDLLKRWLERDGQEVVLAASGQEGLVALGRNGIDVVLLDILMPDMNGIDVLSRIRNEEAWRRLPVIMISGLKEMEAVIRCIEAGADDYLSRPVSPVLLRARIDACLERKQWQDREKSYLAQIEVEKERSDALLHAILPGQVVRRLKGGEDVIADRFDMVTVLFADIVGFTPIAARLSPARLVNRLDSVFGKFDVMARTHGVEKIKTIGDAYMAAAGVPEHSSDHADRVIAMARAMVSSLGESDDDGIPLEMRIGIHTGPVIAGLLGQHRFIYDMWGETVNIASRLEASGIANRIHISETTLRALSRTVPTEARGVIELRGVGSLSSYFVG